MSEECRVLFAHSKYLRIAENGSVGRCPIGKVSAAADFLIWTQSGRSSRA